MTKHKIMLQDSNGLWIEWPRNYKTKKAAKQAAHHLRKKFKTQFWRSYYRDIEPKVIKK